MYYCIKWSIESATIGLEIGGCQLYTGFPGGHRTYLTLLNNRWCVEWDEGTFVRDHTVAVLIRSETR